MKKHLAKYVSIAALGILAALVVFTVVNKKETVQANTNAAVTYPQQADTQKNNPVTVGNSVYTSTYSKTYQANSFNNSGTLFRRGDKAKKLIALTFDDGPDHRNTPKVLAVLKKYNVKATFFLIGKQVVRFDDTARQIVYEGHEIGNHTYNHKALSKKNSQAVSDEILSANKVIEATTGVSTKLFRPPYGMENPETLAVVKKLGLKAIMWTVDTDDWKAPPVTKLINYEINHAENGAIILMHSGEGQKLDATIKALPFVITTLHKKGYQFVTVSELLNLDKNSNN